jgi:hypothetical protein
LFSDWAIAGITHRSAASSFYEGKQGIGIDEFCQLESIHSRKCAALKWTT